MQNNNIAPIPGITETPELNKNIAPIPGIASDNPIPYDYSHSLGYSHKPVNFKDIQDDTKLELMANAGAYSTVKAIGTGLAATANPIGMTFGAIAYLGSEGYAFAKSATLARDEDAFWTEHFKMVNEVIAEKGTMGDMLAGFSQGTSFFTGSNTPEEVKVVGNSGAFLTGDIVGMLTRDFTMMSIGAGALKHLGTGVSKARTALSKAQALASEASEAGKVTTQGLQAVADAEQALATAMSTATTTGSNAGFVAGSSISNALNTATDSYANDGGVINAMRNGFAHGAATGITGHFFLNHFAGAMKKVMPRLLDTTIGASIKSGTEFSAWGIGEELTRATLVNGMGGDMDIHIDPITYAAMFGLGAAGSAIFRSRKGVEMLDDIVEEVTVKKITEIATSNKTNEVVAKTIDKDLTVKRILKKEIKSMVSINGFSLKSPEEIRTLANSIVAEGKATGKSYREILIEKMTNDARYVNMSGDDIDHISKMVFERFIR